MTHVIRYVDSADRPAIEITGEDRAVRPLAVRAWPSCSPCHWPTSVPRWGKPRTVYRFRAPSHGCCHQWTA